MARMIFFLGVTPSREIAVFAAQPIPKGKSLPVFAVGDYHLWRKSTIAKLPAGVEDLLRMCVLDKDGAHGPEDFNRPSVGWYIRDSAGIAPTAYHKNYLFFAARNIAAGEEITVDFTTLGDDVIRRRSEFSVPQESLRHVFLPWASVWVKWKEIPSGGGPDGGA